MNYFIKFIILIIFFSQNLYSETVEKILFSFNNKIFTTIDLNQRIEYLRILNKDNRTISRDIYQDDFIAVLLFNEYSINKKIKIEKKIIDNYYKKIREQYKSEDIKLYNQLINDELLPKEIILLNIKYDYQRKIILEEILKSKKFDSKKLYNDNSLLNIYDIKIEYFLINQEKNEFDEKIFSLIYFEDIEKTKKNLDKELIEYDYQSSKITSLDKIDKEIRIKIKENIDVFYINKDSYQIIGKIEKNIKPNIGLRYSFYQIFNTTNFNIDKEQVNCDNINKIENQNIKKFSEIEVNKLNEVITKNLINIDDKIKIENNGQESLIILCDLKYNQSISNQILENEKINNVIKNIEKEFIIKNKLKYNFKFNE